MDLEYGPEYQDFTKEVQSFCQKYKGLSFTDGSKNLLGSSGGSGGSEMSRSEWQKTLIESGYFARSVPKEYGGYGGCLLYTSPSPRDVEESRMPSSA